MNNRWEFIKGDKSRDEFYYDAWVSFQDGNKLEVVQYDCTALVFINDYEINAIFTSLESAMNFAEITSQTEAEIYQ